MAYSCNLYNQRIQLDDIRQQQLFDNIHYAYTLLYSHYLTVTMSTTHEAATVPDCLHILMKFYPGPISNASCHSHNFELTIEKSPNTLWCSYNIVETCSKSHITINNISPKTHANTSKMKPIFPNNELDEFLFSPYNQ